MEMAGTIFSGTYLQGIVLSNPATQNPATIGTAGYIKNIGSTHNGDAVYGSTVPWTLNNLGTIFADGSSADGVRLTQGGSLSNGQAGATSALVAGRNDGVYIGGATGTVNNFATIT